MQNTMRAKRFRRWPRRLLIGLGLLVLLLCLLPYLVPVSEATPPATKPFGNSAFATVDGVQLHYRSWMPAQSPADTPAGRVLLIHGLGGSTVSWAENVAALQSAGYWTVAVDLPGFGYSSRQAGLDHSQANRARLLWSFLDTLDETGAANAGSQTNAIDPPDRRWNLVGHSMGGGTATAMALARPEQAAALILVDGAVFDNAPGAAGLLLRLPPAARWLQVLLERFLITPERIAGVLEDASGQPVPALRADAYYQALTVPGTARALIDLMRTARSEPIDGLNRLNLPVRAIWGGADQWVPLALGEQLQQRVPSLELHVIPEAGHLPMETHAERFNALLAGLLA